MALTTLFAAHASAAPPARNLDEELAVHSRGVYACIEHELAARPLLEGELSADVDVAADGRVVDAAIVDSSFPDDGALRGCLVTAWRALRVAPPPHGHTVVRTKVKWRGAAGCAGGFGPGGLPPGAIRGSLDKEMVRIVIRSHLDEVRSCYERRMTGTNDPEGRVMIQFEIARDGSVVGSVVQSSTIADDKIATCIAALPRGWRFPRPCGGVVIVSYPFVLKAWKP